MYVARAFHGGATIPGKLVPSHRTTYVAWGGKENAEEHYEVKRQKISDTKPSGFADLLMLAVCFYPTIEGIM